MGNERETDLPIDKGWAWVIVAAGCFVFGLAAGGLKSQGVLLVELAERYEGVYTTSTLLWVFTVKYTFATLMAPVNGILVVKFSHRTVAAMGIILAMIGYIGMAYAPNLPSLIFLHSVIAGAGEGMIILSPLLVSAQYFNKWKALAVGIIASGGGMGQMIHPNVYRLLFDNYDFRGACLLVGGFYLQFLIPVCLLRPLSYYYRQSTPTAQLKVNKAPDEVPGKELTTSHIVTLSTGRESVSFNHQTGKSVNTDTHFSSLSTIPTQTGSTSCQPGAIAELHCSEAFVDECSNEEPDKVSSKFHRERFIWKIILMPKFFLVVGSILVYSFGSMVTYQCLAALSKEFGLSKSTVAVALILSGAIEIPFRIINGLLADKKLLANTTQYALALFIPGLTCLLGTVLSGLAGVALVLIGMSVAGTSVFSLIPAVIGELLGADYVTSGMSIQIFCQSFAFLSSSYIVGAIYDASGSWRAVYFYIAAVMMSASCFLWPYCLYQWCSQRCTTTRDDSKVVEESSDACSS